VRAILRRVDLLRERGEVETISGRRLRLSAQTLCLHSDTPGCTELARGLRKAVSAVPPLRLRAFAPLR